MAVTTLWLTQFRCFEDTVFEPEPDGLTVLRGENGAGKTSVLEAVGWLATQRSFRGAPREALVRNGAERAVLRAEVATGSRQLSVAAELPVQGTPRAQVNHHSVRRRSELGEALRVSVFSPDDLAVVQGSPGGRRDYLDEVLVGQHPRLEALVTEVERVLRQRAAVLRQAGGRLDPELEHTLAVWDDRLATSGEALAEAREALVARLGPLVAEAYARLCAPAGTGDEIRLSYRRSWAGPLADALAEAQRDDLRRQVTSVGPHRDDLEVRIDERPSRTHASQGEQRSVALSLRLATHRLASDELGQAPVLLLDDVFSELDPHRSAALVAQLPPGQVLLTTAVDPPPVVSAERVVEVAGGRLAAAGRTS